MQNLIRQTKHLSGRSADYNGRGQITWFVGINYRSIVNPNMVKNSQQQYLSLMYPSII